MTGTEFVMVLTLLAAVYAAGTFMLIQNRRRDKRLAAMRETAAQHGVCFSSEP